MSVENIRRRNCPVDDVEATFEELEALLREPREVTDDHVGRVEDGSSE